jgi:hypothetical protein
MLDPFMPSILIGDDAIDVENTIRIFHKLKILKNKIAAYYLSVARYLLKPIETDVFFNTISALTTYWVSLEIPKWA